MGRIIGIILFILGLIYLFLPIIGNVIKENTGDDYVEQISINLQNNINEKAENIINNTSKEINKKEEHVLNINTDSKEMSEEEKQRELIKLIKHRQELEEKLNQIKEEKAEDERLTREIENKLNKIETIILK